MTPIPLCPEKGWVVRNAKGVRVGTVRSVADDNTVRWKSDEHGHTVTSSLRWEDADQNTYRPPVEIPARMRDRPRVPWVDRWLDMGTPEKIRALMDEGLEMNLLDFWAYTRSRIVDDYLVDKFGDGWVDRREAEACEGDPDGDFERAGDR